MPKPKKAKPLCSHGFPVQSSACPECRVPAAPIQAVEAEPITDYGPKMSPRYWVGGAGYSTLAEAKAAGRSNPQAWAFYLGSLVGHGRTREEAWADVLAQAGRYLNGIDQAELEAERLN